MMVDVKKTVLALIACPVTMWSANITFNNAGGNLASEEAGDWIGGAAPTESDGIKIDKGGVYTISHDIKRDNLTVAADGAILRFGDKHLTTTGSVSGKKDNATIVFDGGIFNLSGTGNFSPAQVAGANAAAIVTNGCVITNVSQFNATSYANLSRTVVSGNSRIYAQKCYVGTQGGSGNRLEIVEGAQVHVDGVVSLDGNGSGDQYGGSQLLVSGAGSLLHQVGEETAFVRLGQRLAGDRFVVTEGASAVSDYGGVKLGKEDSRVIVEKGAMLGVPRFYYDGSENATVVSNAIFACSSDFSLAYADGESQYNQTGRSNNVFLATGADASVSIKGPDIFGTGHHNVFRLQDGARLQPSSSMKEFMSQTCNSRFEVSGEGTLFGKSDDQFWVAHGSAVISSNNVISVEDGAKVLAANVYLQGVANEIVISNATVEIEGASDVTFGIGARSAGTPHTNNVLSLAGTMPKLKINNGGNNILPLRLSGGSTLRFRVPKDGFAKGHVPVELACALEIDTTSFFEIDCEEWAAHTGGKLHLIKAKAFFDNKNDPVGTTVSRLNLAVLPPECTLILDKGNVYLKCPRRDGFVVSIR